MERNNLYPIFLKSKNLNFLIIGGGFVAEEKLTFLLKSSPDAKVTMVKDVYHKKYLQGRHIVVATTDIPEINVQVWADCRAEEKLVNVADNPPYCDFYMGGIVTKGNVKIAISTNGKSPTTAKRLRQFFEDVIPDNIDDFVKNLNEYRKTIKGNFEEKVEKLNEFTKSLVEK